MSIIVRAVERRRGRGEITRIKCPTCGECVRGAGLLPESTVEGFVFRCKRCGSYWGLTAHPGTGATQPNTDQREP